MFYHNLLLQISLYAIVSIECAGNIENNENVTPDINTHDKDNFCTLAEQIINNNNAHIEIYQNTVQKFVKKYIVRLSPKFNPPLRWLYKLHINYETDDITKLCNEIEKTHTNINSDKYYHFYTKLFIESAQFSLRTIKTVFELHQKYNENNAECRKALEANPALFDDFIISINWLNSLIDDNYEICLTYNYHNLNTYNESRSNHLQYKYQYCINLRFEDVQNIITNLVKCIQQYYKENDFTSNKKICENESIQKIKEWVDNNNDVQNKEWYKRLMKVAIDHINLYRSTQTEINYLSKPYYATNKKEKKRKYNITDIRKELIEKLQLDTIVKDIYNLKFNTMRMYTEQTIMEAIALITTFEENINRLIAFTKHINQFLLNNTKEKLKTAIQKSTEIPKNTKERCMIEIDKIADDRQCEAETSLPITQAMLEETSNYDVFCDTLINIISNIDLDPIHKDEITIIIQTIKNENGKINALYSTLLTHMNQIIDKKHELDEKRTEIEKIKQYIENHVITTKDIMEGIEAGTLKEKAAMQSKKFFEWCQDTAYSFLDVIIETKSMIVETEELVYKILKEMKKKDR
ncbi:hypothetical protein BDAP_000326 [Binucleata daphniae]